MISIKARKKLWKQFYDLSSPVTRLLITGYPGIYKDRPPLYWEFAQERIDWALRRYDRQMELIHVLDDHTIPNLNLLTGTEVFAEAFGCDVFRPKDDNPCAKPIVFSPEDAAKLKMPRLEDTKLMLLFEMAHKMRSIAGPDAPISLPDVQTPVDVAALIWEKSDFYLTMFDEPEAVKDLITMVRTFMFEFFDKWYSEFGTDGMAHYPEYYNPGFTTLSEDEIGIVNPEMFREFFREDLLEFSKRYNGLGIHCCADSKHQWSNLAELPGLKLINLHRGEEETYESFSVFGDVCALLPMTDPSVDFDKPQGAERYHICDNRYYPDTLDDAKRLVDTFYSKYPFMADLAKKAEED